MRLIIDIFKAIGVKMADEIMLMNDYLRLENDAAHKLLKQHGITSRQLSDTIKQELSTRARDLNPLSRIAVVKIASPKTVAYKWFNKAKNKMYDSSGKQPEKKKAGRPKTDNEIRSEIIQLANRNPSYSYRDIANKLTNTNSKVSHETVRKILNEEGISPSSDRIKGMRWFDFMKTSGLWQMDCTTTHITVKNELTNKYEIVCYHILLFINEFVLKSPLF